MGGDDGCDGPRGRVLVVEDEPAIRTLVQLALQRVELDVWTAQDGADALDLLREESFDIILLDFLMPGMTGLELSSRVRRLDPTLPIALLSGSAALLTDEEIAAAGITYTFAKPFDLQALIDWIDAVPPCRA